MVSIPARTSVLEFFKKNSKKNFKKYIFQIFSVARVQNCVIAGIMVVEFADDDIEPFSKVSGSDGSRTELRACRACGGLAAREKPAHGGACVN